MTTARSSRNALRRSPKNGALTATALSVLRMALTTNVERASPSTSSAMISSGLPDSATFSSSGSTSGSELIFSRCSSTSASSSTASCAVEVGDEVGRDEALVEADALGDLELGVQRRGLLDRDDAVGADLGHRLADEFADHLVTRGHGRDLGDAVLVADRRCGGEQCLGHRVGGLGDAQPQLDGVGARGHVASGRP